MNEMVVVSEEKRDSFMVVQSLKFMKRAQLQLL